jgi:hypothetical protein
MVDTVKLLIPVPKPLSLDGSRFTPTISELVNSSKYGKAVLNPSPTYAKAGKYMPRLTMFKRPSNFGPVYQLAVEFSAPKMLFGNNFDELTEADFEPLLEALQDKLEELVRMRYLKIQLARCEVGAWHPSKNIVFLDYISVQTILNTIGKLDISHVYDVQKTDFRDGQVLHIHCNSLDIAFYDKMADLRKAKKSEKRALESENAIQLNLFEGLEDFRPLNVFRYEVRLVGKASIKRAYPQLEACTFGALFNKQLCQELLIKHWQAIAASVDMLSLDVKQPYELLQNYLEENEDITPQTAMAAVAGLMIVGQVGAAGLRNVLEAPEAYRYQAFIRIDEVLEQFRPTYMSDYREKVANS